MPMLNEAGAVAVQIKAAVHEQAGRAVEYQGQPWSESGNCVGVGQELFMLEKRKSQINPAARALCELCDVQRPCLEFALKFRMHRNDLLEVWGGMTGLERAEENIRRQR